jgi:hypothetical protein
MLKASCSIPGLSVRSGHGLLEKQNAQHRIQLLAGFSDAIGKVGSHALDGEFFQQMFPEQARPILVEHPAPFGTQVAPRTE